jgi:transcription initiation factor TFIIE subunit beta
VFMLEELEASEDIIIMRGLGTEAWKMCGLPRLGRASGVNGLKVNEGGGGARMKSVWWDHVKERGRAGKRVEDGEQIVDDCADDLELIFAWDDVRIEEADDVSKLLRDRRSCRNESCP